MIVTVDQSVRRLRRLIRKEWRAVELELKRLIKAGDDEAERYLRFRTIEAETRHFEDWRAWRLQQPPFVTKKGRIYYAHPVTPENRNLLIPRLRAARATP